MRIEKTKEIFAKKLGQAGFKRVKILVKRGRGDFINRVAYDVAAGKLSVIRVEDFGQEVNGASVIEKVGQVLFLFGNGQISPQALIVKHCKDKALSILSKKELKFPSFCVDMSYFGRLKDREKKSLLKQIAAAFGYVRDFFTPENFFILDEFGSSKDALERFFQPFVPFKVFKKLPHDKVIVLDPNASDVLNRDEVDKETIFLFGGIIDHGHRMKGETAKIFPEFKHRKVAYRGSILPVPDRISELTKIICQYITGEESLDEVVRKNMTRDSVLRFAREFFKKKIQRYRFKDGLKRGVFESDIRDFSTELKASEFIIRKAAEHLSGFYVFKDELKRISCKEIKEGKGACYVERDSNEFILRRYP